MKPGAVVAGRYTIEKELGRGGMGAVFIAKDSKFGDRVALKVASVAGLTLDEFRERFAREARIGHRLGRTEGFVRALDWGELEDTSLYLAMDLVDGARPLDLVGGTLDERLERLARAAKLVVTAHALGVIHRDLKPANILTAADGRIFLADFGLAKSRDVEDAAQSQLTRTGLGMGTPAYMPPEQFEDSRSADERADVYALGVMIFVAITGKLPYDGSPTAILQRQIRVQEGRDTPPRARTLQPSLSPALDELCARAIALDRNDRVASVAQLLQGITAARGGAADVVGQAPTLSAQPTVAVPHSTPVVRTVTPPVPPTPPSSHVRRVLPPPPTVPQSGPQPMPPQQPKTVKQSNQNLIGIAIIVLGFLIMTFCCLARVLVEGGN